MNICPTDAIKVYENMCGIHLCPSETEGFGHYIMEALSAGAVVVTTDAPPMNEFVTDAAAWQASNRSEPWGLATNYFVDPAKLEETVNALMQLPVSELT